MLVVALDCDEIAHRVGRKTKGAAPVNLSIHAKRREENCDSAADEVAEMILNGGRP
jgi:hypothetical protein